MNTLKIMTKGAEAVLVGVGVSLIVFLILLSIILFFAFPLILEESVGPGWIHCYWIHLVLIFYATGREYSGKKK